LIADDDGILTEAERAKNQKTLEGYLKRVVELEKVVVERLQNDLETDLDKINGPDREAALKLTRFRGHPNICVQGVHDGEDETTLHT
jgi:hypothetical protein